MKDMKRLQHILTIAICAMAVAFPSCETAEPVQGNGDGDNTTDGTLPERVTALQRNIVKDKPDNGARIVWDHPSLAKISNECGSYSRVIKLQDGTFMATYEACSGCIVIKRSEDGITWPATTEQRIVPTYGLMSPQGQVVMRPAMPFLCQLTNGTILCANNFCPQTPGLVPYQIAVCRSEDNGKTWTQREIVYEGGCIFEDGCWEPAILQLPDGEVHLYIANEAPYSTSNKQEISFFTSTDSGKTWSRDFKTASIRSTGRDGMPCPCIFEDEIVIIVEDIFHVELKPTTVRCKVSEKWRTPVTDNSPGRDYNLLNIPKEKYAGAPYLVKLNSGEAVISYQTVDNPEGINTMDVAIGDRNARNFGRRTQPFGDFIGKSSLWNSLCVMDDYTIGAVGAPEGTPVLKRGHAMAQIRAEKDKVGRWPIYIGNDGKETLHAGIAVTDKELVFDIKVKDTEIAVEGTNHDEVTIYFDSMDKGYAKPYKGVFRIITGPTGDVGIWEGNNGRWVEIDPSNVSVTAEETAGGYDLKVSLNRGFIPKMNTKSVRAGFTLAAYNDGGKGFTESIIYMSATNPCSWLQILMP